MTQVKITRVLVSDKKKDGTPYISKEGRPYSKLGLQTEEYGDRWLSGFVGSWNKDWKVGSVVELDLLENVGSDGTKYLNFSKPDPITELTRQFNSLADRVSSLEARFVSPAPVVRSAVSDAETAPVKISESDLPF